VGGAARRKGVLPPDTDSTVMMASGEAFSSLTIYSNIKFRAKNQAAHDDLKVCFAGQGPSASKDSSL